MATFLCGYVVVCTGIVLFVARLRHRQSILERSIAELKERLAERGSREFSDRALSGNCDVADLRAA